MRQVQGSTTLMSLLAALLLLVGVADVQAQIVDAGWAAFVIREANDGVTGPPIIQNDDVVTDALEIAIISGGQKAGLGTDLINGARLDQITALHVDRLDDVPNSGSLYGPYFNIWVTDGTGQYATLANEPSDGEWAGSRWDVPDWAFLGTKRCKVYEVPGASGSLPGTSWVADYAQANGWDGVEHLRFEHVAGLVIAPPPPAYIQDANNMVGSGAADELGTDIARGFNWIFGDTAENYISGGDGFIVDNYLAQRSFPVQNLTQGTTYDTIAAALADANANDEILANAGTFEPAATLVIDKALTLRGAGADQTFIKSGTVTPLISVTADNVTIEDLALTDDDQLVEGINVTALNNLTLDGVDVLNLGNNPGPGNAYGLNIVSDLTGLDVDACSFIATNLGEYSRAIGIFVPNDHALQDFSVDGSDFQYLFVGIYLRSGIDGLAVANNTFGPFELPDGNAAAAGVYIGDGSDDAFDLTNVTVTGNTFTQYNRGVYVWNYAANATVGDVVISGNTFANSLWSSGIRFIFGLNGMKDFSITGTTNGILIHDNEFTQDAAVGGYVSLIDLRTYDANLLACDIDVTGNDITFTGGPYVDAMNGIRVAPGSGAFYNTVISGNTLAGGGIGGAGSPGASGLAIAHYGSDGSWPVDLELDITGNQISGFDYGLSVYDVVNSVEGGLPAGTDVQVTGNLIAGNTTGLSNPASAVIAAVGNDWGDVSGPYAEFANPGGTGDAVEGQVLFTPWTGRTTTVVAELVSGPDNRTLADDGYGFWEGTPALGLDDDSAPGFDPGAHQGNVQSGDTPYTKYGITPLAAFGRPVNMAELHRISYFTKKDTTHDVVAPDWFFQMYTEPYDGSPGSGWYGNRINSEPYFSENIVETAGEWTQWQTDAGQPNRLRLFDSSTGYLGGYTDGFLQDMVTDPDYDDQPIMFLALGTGSAWAEGFDGRLDGLQIELVNGEIVTLNFTSGNAHVAAVPATSGPLPCGVSQDVTFGVELTADMPDLFLYNAVVRYTGEVEVTDIEDELPFTDDNETFYALDNGDGSWTITGSTVANPTHPVTAPGAADLFTITFNTLSDGDAAITFDSLVLRDTENNTIPVIATGATITVDCTAPALVTDITAEPGHNKVDVSWTHDGSDVDHFEVYRAVWYDATPGTSAYPEYDDLTGDVIPARPLDHAAAVAVGSIWELVDGNVPSGTTAITDAGMTSGRGVYYYEVFAIDAAANPSPRAVANDGATNYWLGDFNEDGYVNIGDITLLGESFGLQDTASPPVTPDWGGSAVEDHIQDIGPTDDWSRTGIPTTDSRVDFEDLMIAALNFGMVTDGTKSDVTISESVNLAWVQYSENRWALRLLGGQGLQGVHVRLDLPEGGAISVSGGDLLDSQSSEHFLGAIGNDLDINLALLGAGASFTGEGDLFVVSTNVPLSAESLAIEARNLENGGMTVELAQMTDVDLPRVFSLDANYPNPFNPATSIRFALPESQPVRLTIYGIDGRLVATLVDDDFPAGNHEVTWHGRDMSGRMVASGTYMYRIDAGPYSAVRKMTLMK